MGLYESRAIDAIQNQERKEQERKEQEQERKFEDSFNDFQATVRRNKFICFNDLAESGIFSAYQLSEIKEKFKDVDKNHLYLMSTTYTPKKLYKILELLEETSLCFSLTKTPDKLVLRPLNIDVDICIAYFPNKHDFVKLLNDYGSLYDDLKQLDETLRNFSYEELLLTKITQRRKAWDSTMNLDVWSNPEICAFDVQGRFDKISKKLPAKFVSKKKDTSVIYLTFIQAQKFICMQINEKEYLRLVREFASQKISAIANASEETSTTETITEIEGQPN